MLTGIYKPTYGEIYVDGKPFSQYGTDIQGGFGICSQFDYFWPHFSPRQMFMVIGLFRGFDRDTVTSECERLLKVFSLYKHIDGDTKTFSGGMKRKLSVALACMKGFNTIILDEPTSGMDPISRFEVWNAINAMKKDHTIILTTHSMEEADVMSDRIAIMYMGRLRAIGSPYGLKETHGKGYKLDVSLNDNCNANEIFDLMNVMTGTLREA